MSTNEEQITASREKSVNELVAGGARVNLTPEQIETKRNEMNEVLAQRLLTDENIESGAVTVAVDKEVHPGKAKGTIGYEYEVERETRYIIKPQPLENYKWVNHVIDVYDQSGRARIRVKNGAPRLSLKVPLFTKDTENSKVCLRLEFKPLNKDQEADLQRIRQLIIEEAGAQVSEKWGAPLVMPNGQSIWINRDNKDNWWIEVDEGEDFVAPDGIEVMGVSKSSVKTGNK